VTFQGMPALAEGDSSDNLRRQLYGFITACLQSSLHSRDPDVHSRPTLKQVIKAMQIGQLVLDGQSLNALAGIPMTWLFSEFGPEDQVRVAAGQQLN
jgi:hypothetical protein